MKIFIVEFPDPAAGRAAFLTEFVWRILAARIQRGAR